MYFEIGCKEVLLGEIYESGNISKFLAETANLFISIARDSSLRGGDLFETSSDSRIEELSNWLARPSKLPLQVNTVVHIATELYSTGGHTRVLEDIVRAMPERKHIVILTDLLGRYSSGKATLAPLEQRFKEIGLEVCWLPQGDLLNRVLMLIAMVNKLSPGAIFVNAHPFDTVAYAGISGKSAPRVLLLHHADHYPALGSARNDYLHVDLTDICHTTCCSSHLHSPKLLSMTVEDRGVVPLDYKDGLVGAVSGSINKFEGNVGGTYAKLLGAMFLGGVNMMHHIGDLRQQQIDEIYDEINSKGIDHKRIVFHGKVSSLSLKLKEIRPNFVLNSHPIGGGKAIIEAISLGLPLMHYSPPEKLPVPNWVYSMGDCILLRDLSEADEAVQEMAARGAEMGKVNRAIYENRHTPEAFSRTLKELTAFYGVDS